ncbi:MAG: phage integrase family protein [Firmicutes bacterium]|nr:phage integrase family protein [Bacillota bacterium]
MRSVPLPRAVAAALSAHLVTEKARLGNRWSPKALVFDRGDGTPILPTDLTHAWARARKAAGLDPRIRLHDLRGSYLTWLAERGVDVKTAAELAGHADIKMTAEIYQRVSRRMLRRAARAVEGLTRLRAKK